MRIRKLMNEATALTNLKHKLDQRFLEKIASAASSWQQSPALQAFVVHDQSGKPQLDEIVLPMYSRLFQCKPVFGL